MHPTLLILAAGIGSRYGGLKQLDQIGPSGETILDYSIYDAIRAGFGKVVFVIRRNIEHEFKEAIIDKLAGKIDVEYVLQEIDMIPAGVSYPPDRMKPWGTGHAVLMAAEKIREPFAVINADDFYGEGSYRSAAEFLNRQDAENVYCLVGYELGRTLSEFGSVARGVCETDDHGFLATISERTNIERTGPDIFYRDPQGRKERLPEKAVVSMNFWGFRPGIFDFLRSGFETFIKDNAAVPKSEFFLPFVIDDLVNSGNIKVRVLQCQDQWFGVTYQEDKPRTMDNIAKLVKEGKYPDPLWS